MVFLRIYNDDKIRKWNNFPTLKDPMVLENTLLRILNELFMTMGLSIESEFNIHNPKFYDLYLTYYTSSNFNSWGMLPLGYIYNDMVRLIQNQNSTNNYIMTLESIEVSNDMAIKTYSSSGESANMTGELVSAYILENYMLSYGYIKNHNNGVLTIKIPYSDKTIIYIISVGFNSYNNAIWFSTDNGPCTPYSRYRSIEGLVNLKYDKFSLYENSKVLYEAAEGKVRSNIDYCKNLISGYELSGLKKTSEYDTETKYGNYAIDYNWLSIYDNIVPAVMFAYKTKNGTIYIDKFSYDSEDRVDYRLLKKENELVKIAEKKKEDIEK